MEDIEQEAEELTTDTSASEATEQVTETEEVMAHPEMKSLLASFKETSENEEVSDEEVGEGTEAEEQEASESTEAAAAPAAEETESWITAKDRVLARFIGLTETELAGLSSRSELAELEAYHKSLAATPVKETEEEAEAEPEYVDKPFLANGEINVEWFRKHDYDEGMIAVAEGQAKQAKANAAIAKALEEDRARMAHDHRARDLNEFHDALDRIDGEFFGKTLSERGETLTISEKLGERRSKVYAQLGLAAESLAIRYGHPPTMSQQVELAAQLAYEKELKDIASRRSEAARKGQLTKLHKQSTRVRPASSPGKAMPKAKKSEPDTVESVMAHPEMQAMLAKFSEDNGS